MTDLIGIPSADTKRRIYAALLFLALNVWFVVRIVFMAYRVADLNGKFPEPPLVINDYFFVDGST